MLFAFLSNKQLVIFRVSLGINSNEMILRCTAIDLFSISPIREFRTVQYEVKRQVSMEICRISNMQKMHIANSNVRTLASYPPLHQRRRLLTSFIQHQIMRSTFNNLNRCLVMLRGFLEFIHADESIGRSTNDQHRAIDPMCQRDKEP